MKIKHGILTCFLTITIAANIGCRQQTNGLQKDTNKSNTKIDTIQGQTVLKICDKMP